MVAALQVSWQAVFDEEGNNDGLASVTSQRWKARLTGTKTKDVRQLPFLSGGEADHLNELGWWDTGELHRWPWWWNFRLRGRIREFEDRVKNAYLKVARDAERVVAQQEAAAATQTP